MISQAEQYLLELINRGRLDPNAEASRYGIDLNDDISGTQITADAKQALAHNALLEASAQGHSEWMLAANTFSHTGNGGSSVRDRIEDANYQLTGSWTIGENIAWRGTTGTINLETAIEQHHEGLFLSSGHRKNTMKDAFREVGLSQVEGNFFHDGRIWSSSMLTQNFAKAGTDIFVTGVVYQDTDDDNFFSIGEGRSGASFSIGGNIASSISSGGYALKTSAASQITVNVSYGGFAGQIQVQPGGENVKIDIVDGNKLMLSKSAMILSGIGYAELLGVANLNLTGSSGAEELVGNKSSNVLSGQSGNDILKGLGGNDVLSGGNGIDYLFGGAGNDNLQGGAGNDTLFGNQGADTMDGGDNSDMYFADGDDVVTDTGSSGYDKVLINLASGENLSLNGWSGVERVIGYTGNDTIDASTMSNTMVLLGEGGNDFIVGGTGSDIILGGDGDDTLNAAGGNDTILTGSGADSINAGNGNDIIFIGDADDTAVKGGNGFDKVVINDATGLSVQVGGWTSIERINGYSGNDNIDASGLATAITITGAGGNDTLTGGSANDTFYAGQGNDIVNGASGNDALIGSNGNDTLDGGSGDDFLSGGLGSDDFVFENGFGQDVIADFDNGTDMIDFSAHSGVNNLGDLNIVQAGSHVRIELASDANQNVTLVDTATGVLDASDFLFA